MELIKDNGDNALSEALVLSILMDMAGHDDLHRKWLEITKAIRDLQGPKVLH